MTSLKIIIFVKKLDHRIIAMEVHLSSIAKIVYVDVKKNKKTITTHLCY